MQEEAIGHPTSKKRGLDTESPPPCQDNIERGFLSPYVNCIGDNSGSNVSADSFSSARKKLVRGNNSRVDKICLVPAHAPSAGVTHDRVRAPSSLDNAAARGCTKLHSAIYGDLYAESLGECYCTLCEPPNFVAKSSKGDNVSAQLSNGWPLSCGDASTRSDDYIQNCLKIYDRVRLTGVPNFLQARIPLLHSLNIQNWRRYLKGHSDISLPDFLEFGFPIGFDPGCSVRADFTNHASARKFPTHVDKYIAKEVQEHALLGPFDSPPFWPWVHCSPLMTREKRASVARRVILDLSWPSEASVNGGTAIETYMGEKFKLVLPTAQDLAQIISHFGRGCKLWALDLARAYRQWRADPLDWPLLGIVWGKSYYIDTAIAFGLRHGASFAQRVSGAVCDILESEQHTALSYIDDFAGAQESLSTATTAYNRAIDLLQELGLEQNKDKAIPPTSQLIWIGVLFNTDIMQMSIPPGVLEDTRLLVVKWLHKQRATRHELQQVLGKLFHSGKCCAAARLFVGRMLETLRAAPPQGTIHLSQGFKLDLKWFADFLPSFNGICLIHTTRESTHVGVVVGPTSVTLSWEFNICYHSLNATEGTSASFIASLHIWAILVATVLWGANWGGKQVVIHVSNPDKIQVLLHGRSRNSKLLVMARKIWLVVAKIDCVFIPQGDPLLNHTDTCLREWEVPPALLKFMW
jgi:hypothetical protein